MKGYRILMGLAVWTSGLLSGGVARAADISGNISKTMTITEDSRFGRRCHLYRCSREGAVHRDRGLPHPAESQRLYHHGTS